MSGANSALYAAGMGRRFWGPLGYNLHGFAIVDADDPEGSLYGIGPEFSLFRGTRRLVPYAVAGAGVALRPQGAPQFTAVWHAGLGLEFNPLASLGLAVEASRWVEDGGFRGFWDLDASDRRGWVLSGRLSVRWGGRPHHTRGPSVTDPTPIESVRRGPAEYTPEPADPEADAVAWLALRIVDTALEAMGEPYRWGGTSTDEGFDCSGLVWYAYTTHGVDVPRMSRDQARLGRRIAANVDSLEPGDILVFSNRRGVVTHVGLYVGDAEFIHATTSGGVRIGTLDGRGDANDSWYLARWIGARRVLR